MADLLKRCRFGICLGLLVAASGPAAVAIDRASAQTLILEARAQASAEGKAVLVQFGGSPCEWCERLGELLQAEPARSFVSDNYVVLKLQVYDIDESKETPGALAAMNAWGPTRCGVPFYVILTSDGQKATDWCGFPMAREDVDELLEFILDTAPRGEAAKRSQVAEGVRRTLRHWAANRYGFFSWHHLRAACRAELLVAFGLAAIGAMGSWLIHKRRRRIRVSA